MIKKMTEEPRSLGEYLRKLQRQGKLKIYFTSNGCVAYDTEEYTRYKKGSKIGRPIEFNGGQNITSIKTEEEKYQSWKHKLLEKSNVQVTDEELRKIYNSIFD